MTAHDPRCTSFGHSRSLWYTVAARSRAPIAANHGQEAWLGECIALPRLSMVAYKAVGRGGSWSSISICLLILVGCETGDSRPGDDDDRPEAREPFDSACYVCHGNSLSPAPPRAIGGGSDTADVGIGAHQTHLRTSSAWHRAIPCETCHIVPDAVDSVGHISDDDNQAELTFAALAIASGAKPTWNREAETCSNVYCHGSTMNAGGSILAPQWTLANGTQNTCGTCHGAPPPEPHSQSENCGSCHPTMEPNSLVFRDPDSHIDGKVDVGDGLSCDSCHGSNGRSAPPNDLQGNTDRASLGVGAHSVHLAPSTWRREISCSNCHVAPVDVGDPGHLDGDDIAEVPFDSLNPVAAFNRGNATCSSLYCHGNGRGSNGSVIWTRTQSLSCTSCHSMSGNGLGGEHDEHIGEDGIDCVDCHSDVVDGSRDIVNAALHVNGIREINMEQGSYEPGNKRCSNLACHENETW